MIRTGNEKLDNKTLVLPVGAGESISEATMVAIGADGYAGAAYAAAGITVAGVAMEPADNRAGADGDLHVKVRRGAFVFDNSATPANMVKETDILKECYIEDARTVSMSAEGSSVAGRVIAVEDDGVTVEFR